MNSDISLTHILTLMARLDLLIRREVLRLRIDAPDGDDKFRGLYITDEEVDELLSGWPAAAILERPLPPSAELDALERGIEELDVRAARLEENGATLRLNKLCRILGLDEFARQVVVIALAAEMDLRYEKLFSYLQDDVSKKRPTVALIMQLLCRTVEERVMARRAFGSESPLMRWDVVTLHDDPGARKPVLLGRYCKLDEWIASFLLGLNESDPRLAPITSRETSSHPMSPRIYKTLEKWVGTWGKNGNERGPVILFHGRYGTGRTTAAQFLAQTLEKPLLRLDANRMLATEFGIEQAIKLAERTARLNGGIICWENADLLLDPEHGEEAQAPAFMGGLASGQAPTILLSEKEWESTHRLDTRPFVRLEFTGPDHAQRRALWSDYVRDSGAELSTEELNELAARFRLTGGQIQDAISRARTLAWGNDSDDGRVALRDIEAACRTQAQPRLNTLARRLRSRYTWDDIVLPPAQLGMLRLICTTVRQRPRVYEEWGFDRKLAMGKGLIALFSGPSGTGKTMASEIIANDLGLDLYKIDLSAVVSKYIGETEKNLERIFSEAQNTDAILFFDEADALFGKRSETRDAHDRYANIEIAYLLQRTEEYNGLVILASNIKKNMDEAFVRRLHFTIDFPFPEEPERLEIWRRTFPREAPRGEDLDLSFMARKFKIAGGNIRNVILMAAFIASEECASIAMRHLIRGAAYELQKIGKLVNESDFEKYFEIAKMA